MSIVRLSMPFLYIILISSIILFSNINCSFSKEKKRQQKDYGVLCGAQKITSRGNKLLNFLGKHSTKYAFTFTAMPQYKSLCWIIYEDPKKLKLGFLKNKEKILQRYALGVFYYATNGVLFEKWHNETKWLTRSNECKWLGIKCDTLGHVIAIDLPYNNLNGILPSEVFLLKHLRRLELQANELHGVIPIDIGEARKLKDLKLFNNAFIGEIPSSLGRLKDLRELRLYGTSISGSIPKEIGNLTKLEFLDVYGTNLNGTIPTEISNLKKLREVYMNDCYFTGTVPPINSKNIQEVWADCRGKVEEAEVQCDFCTVCCNDTAMPKCIRSKADPHTKKNKKRDNAKK